WEDELLNSLPESWDETALALSADNVDPVLVIELEDINK
ncbi:hypothetical protein JL09_g6040, partial [Pichia kudriavzevii]